MILRFSPVSATPADLLAISMAAEFRQEFLTMINDVLQSSRYPSKSHISEILSKNYSWTKQSKDD